MSKKGPPPRVPFLHKKMLFKRWGWVIPFWIFVYILLWDRNYIFVLGAQKHYHLIIIFKILISQNIQIFTLFPLRLSKRPQRLSFDEKIKCLALQTVRKMKKMQHMSKKGGPPRVPFLCKKCVLRGGVGDTIFRLLFIFFCGTKIIFLCWALENTII